MGRYGSSPRGRGTLAWDWRNSGKVRFIPAWAGNTRSFPWCASTTPVHPRVGGEHADLPKVKLAVDGSSPRGRGTQPTSDRRYHGIRFIPAWAGNTSSMRIGNTGHTVHPRVGGEHASVSTRTSFVNGSSPRGRGTLRPCSRRTDSSRFIPAWAGNTQPPSSARFRRTVHPRVGGEHLIDLLTAKGNNGSSPRGRGTLRAGVVDDELYRFIPAWAGNTEPASCRCDRETVHPRVGGEHPNVAMPSAFNTGSSPRGRGTPTSSNDFVSLFRFIPAWAGNTLAGNTSPGLLTVHPRVGGEHLCRVVERRRAAGSSPRGRGTPQYENSFTRAVRFIPAWAGNTGSRPRVPAPATVHPRVGGEHGNERHGNRARAGSSPRGRGTHFLEQHPGRADRFIPAWAGNTEMCWLDACRTPVHPRVGGEHCLHPNRFLCRIGSSPRGRGTPRHPRRCIRTDRFIPAWAGNTSQGMISPYGAPVHPRVGGEHPRAGGAAAACGGSSPRGRGTLL